MYAFSWKHARDFPEKRTCFCKFTYVFSEKHHGAKNENLKIYNKD